MPLMKKALSKFADLRLQGQGAIATIDGRKIDHVLNERGLGGNLGHHRLLDNRKYTEELLPMKSESKSNRSCLPW